LVYTFIMDQCDSRGNSTKSKKTNVVSVPAKSNKTQQ
jgi:hypothetical protein